MTAATLARRPRGRQGLLPVRPLRDMASMAALMESAFGEELEPEGRRLIRDMRLFGKAGLLGWLAGRFVLPPAAYPRGFVWYEDRRLVGNASVLPVEDSAGRWVVANVAVLPGYRGRGIGRNMVVACLDLARRGGGREAVLQVDASNEAALGLYRDLGFRRLVERTTYQRPAGTDPAPEFPTGLARERTPGEWREQYTLARSEHPEGVLWPMPVRAELFRGALALGPARARHWVWREEGALVGSLSVRPDWDRASWRFVLVSTEAGRGRVEAGLLALALRHLAPDSAAVLDYPVGAAVPVLANLGFRATRTLIWMGKSLEGP